jgi:hypothetical protein
MNPGLKRLPLRLYRSDRGHEPVREWLKGLEREDRKVIGEDIKEGQHGAASRIYEEAPKDASTGHRSGA